MIDSGKYGTRGSKTIRGINGPIDFPEETVISKPESGKVTSKFLYELVQRQKFRCALSGRELTPETASVDHISPLSVSQDHSPENIQILDIRVNSAKGTMSQEEFIQMCKEVTEWACSQNSKTSQNLEIQSSQPSGQSCSDQSCSDQLSDHDLYHLLAMNRNRPTITQFPKVPPDLCRRFQKT